MTHGFCSGSGLQYERDNTLGHPGEGPGFGDGLDLASQVDADGRLLHVVAKPPDSSKWPLSLTERHASAFAMDLRCGVRSAPSDYPRRTEAMDTKEDFVSVDDVKERSVDHETSGSAAVDDVPADMVCLLVW